MRQRRRLLFKAYFAVLCFGLCLFLAPPSWSGEHKQASIHHSSSATGGHDSASSAPDLIMTILIVVVVVAIYTLPITIAVRRRHRNVIPIALVNIFTGWMLLGWFAALVWSFTADVRDPVQR